MLEPNAAWSYNGEIYGLEDLTSKTTGGTCQAMLVSCSFIAILKIILTNFQDYRWGFSFLQLFIMIILLILWSGGMYIMWLHSHLLMKKRGRNLLAGEHKAVLELADAMRAQIEEHGQETLGHSATLTEFELRRRITKDLNGGAISYKTSVILDGHDGRGDFNWGFKSWLKKEMWWLIAFLLSLAAVGTAVAMYQQPIIFCICVLPFEIKMAMYIGTSNKSRGILLFWSFMASSVVLIPIMLTVIALRNPY